MAFFLSPSDGSVLHVLFPCKGRERREYTKYHMAILRKFVWKPSAIYAKLGIPKNFPKIPWLISPISALLIYQQEKRLYELICTDEQKSDLTQLGFIQKRFLHLIKKKRRLPNLITR